jgi:hypothetical protein
VAFSLRALATLLREDLALTREQVGSLTALCYAGTALAYLPAGWTTDRPWTRPLLIAAQVLGDVPLLAVPLLAAAGPLRLIMFVVGLVYGVSTPDPARCQAKSRRPEIPREAQVLIRSPRSSIAERHLTEGGG